VVDRYHEMVIEGPRGQALGFIFGFLSGRGLTDEVFDAEADGVCCESFREKFRELLRPRRETIHLLVPHALVEPVKEALTLGRKRGFPLELLHERVVARLRFSFSFVVYSREHARRIRSWFERLPEGVTLSRKSVMSERVDPKARGVEAYAPLHDYELKGKGTVEGTVAGVVAVYRRCRDEELVETTHPEPVFEDPKASAED
jgi:hypothetical protein